MKNELVCYCYDICGCCDCGGSNYNFGICVEKQMIPTTRDAYQLFHDGCIELAKIEANGMRVDVPRLDRTIEKVSTRIDQLTKKLKEDEVWIAWEKEYGREANIQSGVQMGKVLFDKMGYECKETTPTGRPKTDEETLTGLKIPFVKRYLEIEKLKKLHSTHLRGIRRELVDGFVHPDFGLHIARSFRSVCSNPNLQNVPIRNKEIGKLVRSCFIPRDGHVMVDIDYGSLEVRVAACYHKDPVMIEYIEDSSKDMHRDAGMECFLLPSDQITKETRFYAKNQFVFPQFYGSYYVECAKDLWSVVKELRTSDSLPMRSHLRQQGIRNYNDFENHIREVENNLWDRFNKYAQWKLDWYRDYQEEGGFDFLTGFRFDGVIDRKQAINIPVQGAAFHCLLWSLIQLNRRLTEKKMKSVIMIQIHDSIFADVAEDELEEYLAMAKQIMEEEIREHWPWIIVPFVVEAETSAVNWWEKKEIEI